MGVAMPRPVRDAPSPKPQPIIASRVLHHPWSDPPRGFARHRLALRWRLRQDGGITSTIVAVIDPKGRTLDRVQWPKDLELDAPECPELDGQDRPIHLTGDLSDPMGRLEGWLVDSSRAIDQTPAVCRP
jgi:hypothetical protein